MKLYKTLSTWIKNWYRTKYVRCILAVDAEFVGTDLSRVIDWETHPLRIWVVYPDTSIMIHKDDFPPIMDDGTFNHEQFFKDMTKSYRLFDITWSRRNLPDGARPLRSRELKEKARGRLECLDD